IEQGEAQGIQFTSSSELELISEEDLLPYGTVVFWGLGAESFSPSQQADLERYVQAGNGLVWVDPTIQSPYTWPWLSAALPSTNSKAEEEVAQKVKDSPTDASHWQESRYDGGRMLIAASEQVLAHPDSWPALLDAAIGPNQYNLSLAHSLRVPDPNRFTRKVLDANDVYEPMELAVLPDHRVLFIERRGRMKLYSPETASTQTIATFEVCIDGNYEDGLLGLTLDPNFAENGYVYLYYSPSAACDRPQTLSRFVLEGDSLVLTSERVIMEVPVQRETCCHSGGSLTFGPEGYLWLSTGDNTSSKESDGYSPLDERPGRGPFDAQKSSGNTHDLRGKILRIDPQEDGSYLIPDGNLFPKDGSEGAPEIYVMGARNPFRIAVDDKTGYVYWGDVGPDVGKDGRYGPQSFDEWNQARTAGNFGWPYFVGNNLAYRKRDFAMDTVGAYFDPIQPVNASPHNTGSELLPAAQPAFIWYPKSRSPEFPMLGQGSNSAMAGPIFHRAGFPEHSDVVFPAYYEGKWFIYEWARSWIQVVTFKENGDLARIEPFLPNLPISKPIDVEFGPDGAMYILEYGQNYFVNNSDAKLIKLEYAANNRLPVAKLAVDQPAGGSPHTATFSAAGSFDYDATDTSLQYFWSFEGERPVAGQQEMTHTFAQTGVFTPTLLLKDGAGGETEASIEVRIGNQPPKILLAYSGNQSFYFPGERQTYEFQIQDPEDAAQGGIQEAAAQVNLVFVGEGYDPDVLLGGTSVPKPSLRFQAGKHLIESSDCSSCHNVYKPSIGPSYEKVSAKYAGDEGALEYLANKIITGGNGVWGEKIMAGHPQHSLEETRKMARYILALAQDQEQGNLGLTGEVTPDPAEAETGAYLLAATYTDRGANGIPALTSRKRLLLRHPRVQAEDFDLVKGLQKGTAGKNREIQVMRGRGSGAYLGLSKVDMSNLGGLNVRISPQQGGTLSIRLDAADGPEIAKLPIPQGKGSPSWRTLRTNWDATTGIHDLYLVWEPVATDRAAIGQIDWVEFH
ncbi:MAG: PQQ-dependent sugar dehydrogenase, partial [Bacteroidota bacterium]